jgi:hypothetical protein
MHMHDSCRRASGGVVAVAVALAWSAAPAIVNAREQPEGVQTQRARTLEAAIRDSGPALAKDQPHGGSRRGLGLSRRVSNGPSRAQRGALIAGGVVAGLFAGGYLGAAIEGDCRCDDPGLKGVLIGMPVGGVLGGLAMAWLTR